MDGNLGQTNIILGIIAAVSVLEAVLIFGAGIAMFMVYRRITALINSVEPAMIRVNAILDDAKAVAATVKAETDRVDHAIRSTMHRVDDTVDRVRSNVRSRTSRIVGLVRGARVALETMLQSRAA
jgi:hypothetical protein